MNKNKLILAVTIVGAVMGIVSAIALLAIIFAEHAAFGFLMTLIGGAWMVIMAQTSK